jgi:two-component system phosphate regulon sensor histidine kinase PhoR
MAARLWLGFIALTVFMIGATAAVHTNVRLNRTAMAVIGREAGQLAVDTFHARADFSNAQSALLEFITTGQRGFRNSYRTSRASLAMVLAGSQATATGQSRLDVEAEQRSAAMWFTFGDRMLTMTSGSAALRQLTLASDASALAFCTASARLHDRLLARARAAARQGQAAIRAAALWGGATALLAVLLGLLACAAVTRASTRPLVRLAAILRSLASGDLAERAALTGAAEVRAVAWSANALAENCARQRTEEEETRQLGAAAREAGIRIRAHLDLTEVLREAAAAIEGFVPDDGAYLHLVQAGRIGLPVAHENDWILPAEFAEFPAEVVPEMADVLTQNSSRVFEDLNGPDSAGIPPKQLAMLRAAGIVSIVVTPFGIGSELGGMIAALRKRPGHPWTPAEIDAFQQIAADIGRALHHARQFEAENRLVDELKALDRRKSTFIATVSYELRTPLTSIADCTEILADAEPGPLTPKQQQILDTISRNTARLRNLIENLLTLSKIESGAFRTAMRPLKLADIITPAVTALEPIAVAAGLTLTSTLPSDDVVVNGDPGQLDRLLVNLLSNAVKFTRHGGHVEVTADTSNGTALITITDTGIGIPLAEPLVLTPFFRGTNAVKRAIPRTGLGLAIAYNAVKRAIPGTGLGLAIAYTIVASHGGEVIIESREGHGTTVTVRIPQVPASQVRGNQKAGSRTQPGRQQAMPVQRGEVSSVGMRQDVQLHSITTKLH